ncbi:hypothetical protein CWC05_18305 [Pseudoalteromonas ruthenica]|uniref:Uncharacterized protein n=2 Tax=Pseudoalteromonas ruthenica TaxID=151081 RepID=A0A5S3YZR3_9GAMM|nr:hypothetical protein CWC05_18305 [Pseudoalteromonas ruthenica]
MSYVLGLLLLTGSCTSQLDKASSNVELDCPKKEKLQTITVNMTKDKDELPSSSPSINVNVTKNLPVPSNLNVNIPEQALKVTMPKQVVEVVIPKNAINVQPLPQKIIIPPEAISVKLARSNLIWATIIISTITLLLSCVALYDKFKKDRNDAKKSVMDDFWFRTVVHPECLTAINDLIAKLSEAIKSPGFDEQIKKKLVEKLYESRESFIQLDILPEGKAVHGRISGQLLSLEDDINAYYLYMSDKSTISELESDETPVPSLLVKERFSQYCNEVKVSLHKEIFNFHSNLVAGIEGTPQQS